MVGIDSNNDNSNDTRITTMSEHAHVQYVRMRGQLLSDSAAAGVH